MLPLFRRDTPPAPQAAPSKHAPAAAHNIPPLQPFRPSQTLVHIPNFPDHFTRLPRRLFQFLPVRPELKTLARFGPILLSACLPPCIADHVLSAQYRNAAQRLHITGGLNVGIVSVDFTPLTASVSLLSTDFTVLPITGGCITVAYSIPSMRVSCP